MVESSEPREGPLPPRVEALRKAMVAAIPCSPDARLELNGLAFGHLLSAYYNWSLRRIPPRPRAFEFAPGFWDARALKHKKAICALAHQIRAGEDLSGFHSKDAAKRGYVARSERGSIWERKDFALSAWEVHHLHLKPRGGGNELLFAFFDRARALAVMLGDHTSWGVDGDLEERVMAMRAASGHLVMQGVEPSGKELSTSDRIRWAWRGLSAAADVNGKRVLGAMITTNGASWLDGAMTGYTQRVVRDLDAKLDEPGFRAAEFPSLVNPFWWFNGSDLYLASEDGLPVALIVSGPL